MEKALKRTQKVAQVLSNLNQVGNYQFSAGAPGIDLLPLKSLKEIFKNTEIAPSDYNYGSLKGYDELRQLISDIWQWNFDPQDIFLTSGSQSAIGLVFRIFENSNIVLEEPTFMVQIINALVNRNKIYSIPLQLTWPYWSLDNLENILRTKTIKLVYVIPNFQNPTGLVMPLEIREKLIWLSKKYDFWILEDDPYGMLGFNTKTTKNPTLYSLAPDKVFYASSFSKILSPGMRLGFIVVKNKDIQSQLLVHKLVSDMHPSTISQRIAVIFLQKYFRDHIQQLREKLKIRASTMYKQLVRYKNIVKIGPKPLGGMFMWLQLSRKLNPTSDIELADELLKHNIAIMPGSIFFSHIPKRNNTFLRLSFASEPPNRIVKGINKMAKVLEELTSYRM